MILKYALIATFTVATFNAVSASRLTDADLSETTSSCVLNEYESAVLNEQWNKLAMKLLLANMGDRSAEIDLNTVRREVDHGVAKLRKRFGPACVLDVR